MLILSAQDLNRAVGQLKLDSRYPASVRAVNDHQLFTLELNAGEEVVDLVERFGGLLIYSKGRHIPRPAFQMPSNVHFHGDKAVVV